MACDDSIAVSQKKAHLTPAPQVLGEVSSISAIYKRLNWEAVEIGVVASVALVREGFKMGSCMEQRACAQGRMTAVRAAIYLRREP